MNKQEHSVDAAADSKNSPLPKPLPGAAATLPVVDSREGVRTGAFSGRDDGGELYGTDRILAYLEAQGDITINEVSDVDSFDVLIAAARRISDEKHAAIEHNAAGTCCPSCQWAVAQDAARVGEGYGR